MKRIIKVFFVLLIALSIKTVYAENYKIKELIPYKVDTTIHTDNFSYKGIYFDKRGVHFNGIKNLTDEKKPISISIGMFDKNGKNIGTINFCEMDLNGKDEMSFIIEFEDKYFGEGKTVKDVKYIAVLGDNITCKKKGSRDFIGQSVDKMGIIHKDTFDDSSKLLISILSVVGGVVLIFIVYKLIFTRAYRNINGDEVREAFNDINKELKEERKAKQVNKFEMVDEEPEKPKEIIEQEEAAKNEDKSSTDLHNLYK